MMPNFLAKMRAKLEWNLPAYFRLLWNVGTRRRKVVIVDFQGALGDLVCFFSSLPGLRQRHPDAWLILITHRHYLDLVRCCGWVDEAAARYGFFHAFARRFCAPDRYYTPTAPPPEGSTAQTVNPPVHTAVHFAQVLGVEPRMDLVYLRPASSVRQKIARRVAVLNPEALPLVVIHTGPTWTVKEWPAAHWDELGRLLGERLRVCVIQIGTEDSDSALHAHTVPRIPGAHDWVNRLSVIESTALLQQAQLFIGIDSGPLHLATTLGIPTIGLFGPVHGPYRAHPRAPFTCLTANVPCLGCHHDPAGEGHWRTGCPYDIRCMQGISVKDVFQATKAALEIGTTDSFSKLSQ